MRRNLGEASQEVADVGSRTRDVAAPSLGEAGCIGDEYGEDTWDAGAEITETGRRCEPKLELGRCEPG